MLASDPTANIIVAGDLNTFQFTDELTEELPGVGSEQVLTNLIPQAEADGDAYTFIFDGNSQVLDNYFVTDSLLAGTEFEVVHVNNDFARDDNRIFFTDTIVGSDHEPLLARFDFSNESSSSLDFLGVVEIPSFTEFDGTTIGGLSGLVFDPSTGNYLSVSDDRGAGDDGTPRFYELSIDLSDGTLDDGDVNFLDVTPLTLDDGVTTLDAINPDPEGIAIAESGDLFISSERDLNGNPAIYTFGQDGVLTGELAVDDKFLPDGTGTRGVRNNLGFESLTLTPSKEVLYTATESALVQDGERSTTTSSSTARIIKYDATTGEAVAEFAYEVAPIANEPNPAGAFADSGLVELLALDDAGTLLALERSFSVGAPDRGYTGKLYIVNTQDATNIIDDESLPGDADFASKTLLADLGDDFGIVVDNIEGMTLGPVLPDGQQSLVIGSDDNFSGFGPQANQFIALALNVESGTDSRDRLLGDDNNNILNGLSGNDRIVGNDGNDTLLGGAGADQLIGGDGDDILRGGLGRDTLVGDEGSDIFVLAPGEGGDRIQDFELGVDVIGLADGITFDDLAFERKSILFDGERLAIFNRGVDARTLAAEDFTVV